MASVFVLLEAFNRKEAAALGFFPCATASFHFPVLHQKFQCGVQTISTVLNTDSRQALLTTEYFRKRFL